MNFADGVRCYAPPKFCWQVDPASGSTDLVGSRLSLWTQASLSADTYADAISNYDALMTLQDSYKLIHRASNESHARVFVRCQSNARTH